MLVIKALLDHETAKITSHLHKEGKAATSNPHTSPKLDSRNMVLDFGNCELPFSKPFDSADNYSNR